MKTILLMIILVVMSTSSCWYARDASNTTFEQTKVSTLLKRYEWFKDSASAIQKKRADIELYESELASGIPVEKDEREYYIQRRTELLGIVSAHNQIVAEYNSAMAKFNYNFTNSGDLPQSNLEPLPRDFQSYKTKIK